MFHGLTGIVATPSFNNCDTKKMFTCMLINCFDKEQYLLEIDLNQHMKTHCLANSFSLQLSCSMKL